MFPILSMESCDCPAPTSIFRLNIGNPTEMSVLECARQVLSVTQSRSKIRYEALPQDDPTRRRPDISNATTLLGWRPTIDLRTGLELSLLSISRPKSRATPPLNAARRCRGHLRQVDVSAKAKLLVTKRVILAIVQKLPSRSVGLEVEAATMGRPPENFS